MNEEYRETGQIAYETYCQVRGGQWVWWADLPQEEQDAWRETAWAVIRRGWVESARPPRHAR